MFHSLPSVAHSELSSRIYGHSFCFYLRLFTLSDRWWTPSLPCFFPTRVHFFPCFGIPLAIWFAVSACRFVFHTVTFSSHWVINSGLLYHCPHPVCFAAFIISNWKMKCGEIWRKTCEMSFVFGQRGVAEMTCSIFGL